MTEEGTNPDESTGAAPKGPTLRYVSPFRTPETATPESTGPQSTGPQSTGPQGSDAAVAGPVSPAPSGHRWLLPAAVVALVLVASASGAVIAHELWTSSSPAGALSNQAAPAGGSQGSLGGTGSFGGSGSSAAANGSGLSNGTSGISLGPNGISVSFGNSASGANGSTAPAGSAAIAAKIDPALVDINTGYSYGGGEGAATGIVVSSNGEVLTNNHVIDGATSVMATDLGNGKTYTAKVVGYSPTQDIAVLQLQGASGLTTATLGDSSKLSVGTQVLGIGNAGGVGGTPSVAGGTVTALNQSITASDASGADAEPLKGLIQTNAGIQPGDSGGPLVDSQGRVVGMDTAGSPGTGFGYGFQRPAGEAYAIPIDQVAKTALQIVAGHSSSTVHIGPSAFLGVQVSPPNSGLGGFGGGSSSVSGVLIAGVLNGEPAQKAGLIAGDVITSLDGQSVGSTSELGSLLLGHHPGDTVKVGWTTGAGQAKSASITLASGPPS